MKTRAFIITCLIISSPQYGNAQSKPKYPKDPKGTELPAELPRRGDNRYIDETKDIILPEDRKLKHPDGTPLDHVKPLEPVLKPRVPDAKVPSKKPIGIIVSEPGTPISGSGGANPSDEVVRDGDPRTSPIRHAEEAPATIPLIDIREWRHEGRARGGKFFVDILTSDLMSKEVKLAIGQHPMKVTRIADLDGVTTISARIPYTATSGQQYPITLRVIGVRQSDGKPNHDTGNVLALNRKKAPDSIDRRSDLVRTVVQGADITESFLVDDEQWSENQPLLTSINTNEAFLAGNFSRITIVVDYLPALFWGQARIYLGLIPASPELVFAHEPAPHPYPKVRQYARIDMAQCLSVANSFSPFDLVGNESSSKEGRSTFAGTFRIWRGCNLTSERSAAVMVVDTESQFRARPPYSGTTVFRGPRLFAFPKSDIRFAAVETPLSAFPERQDIAVTVEATANFFGEQDHRVIANEGGCANVDVGNLVGDLVLGMTSEAHPKNCYIVFGEDIRGIYRADYNWEDQLSPDSKCQSIRPVDDRDALEHFVAYITGNGFVFDRFLPGPLGFRHSLEPPRSPAKGHSKVLLACKGDLIAQHEINRRLESIEYVVDGNLKVNNEYVTEDNVKHLFDPDANICIDSECDF